MATVVGSLATVGAVLLAHFLGERGGEKRANQVREELTARLTIMEQAQSKNTDGIERRLDDFKGETKDRLGRIEADIVDARDEIRRSRDDLKELLRAEIRAATAELRGAISDKIRRAGDPET